MEPAAPLLVLVCADESLWTESSRRLLGSGLKLHRAQGWGEALASARELHPSAVLLESGFLEGAGPELCATLRRAWGTDETPVLALCRGSREVARALSAGASDVVEAPHDWNLIERRLRNLAGVRRSQAELGRNRRMLAVAQSELAEGKRLFEQGSLMDSLTGLPNRLQIERILERALLAAAGPVALMTVELDRFSALNEDLGREAGDEVLRVSAHRLIDCLRAWPGRGGEGPGVMSASRLGGAEFAVMLQNPDPERLGDLAQTVCAALQTPVAVADKVSQLTVNVGIALTTDAGATPQTMVRRAEAAMVAARRSGAPYCLYSEAVSRDTQARRRLDERLRDAFARGGLELHYQPLLAASSRRVVGVEALLRWNDGEQGWIPPTDFVPAAERAGLMGAVGVFVLETACRQLRAWMDDGLPPIRMAINVSRSQIEFGDFASEVSRVLAETRLDPAQLELELSEKSALRRDPGILAQLGKLKATGVRLVVDDFGTGETAVGHLRTHALHGLKIDGAFVQETAGDGPSLTAALAGLGRQLRMEVVAECVETDAQLKRMIEFGCDAVQGFLFSKPLPFAELRARINLSPTLPGVCELAASS